MPAPPTEHATAPPEPMAEPQGDPCAELLRHAPDAVLAVDGQGFVSALNPAAQRLLGWPAGDTAPRRLQQLLVPVRLPPHSEAFARFLQTGDPATLAGHSGLVALELQRADGQPLVVEISAFAAPVHGAPGTGLILRDVTSRRSPERALRQSEERYRTLVEHL